MDSDSTLSIEPRLSEAELDEEMLKTDDVRRLRRLGFIKNLYEGDSVPEAIRREGRSKTTGYRWKRQWEAGGLEEMMPETSPGRPPKLDEAEQEAFRNAVRARQSCTRTELEALLKEQFGVEYAEAYLPQRLVQFGLTYRQPALEKALEADSVGSVEWDTNQHHKTTARHAYDSRPTPQRLWVVDEPTEE